MTRTFIEVPQFTGKWMDLGLGDDELQRLQLSLLKDPEAGPVLEGTGGIRKLRFPLDGKGKRGGIRVCYVDFQEEDTVYLLTVYAKKKQESLSDSEQTELKHLVKQLKEELKKNREGNRKNGKSV